MKKAISALAIISLLVSVAPLYAAQGGTKGAGSCAYDRASDEAVFHRVGDWFATIGKSDAEKETILAERKATRAAARAQKEAEKKKRQLEKETEKAQKKLKKGW